MVLTSLLCACAQTSCGSWLPCGEAVHSTCRRKTKFFYTWRGIRVCGCGLCRRAGCELPDGVRTTQAPSRRASWRARLLSSGLWSPGVVGQCSRHHRVYAEGFGGEMQMERERERGCRERRRPGGDAYKTFVFFI